METVSVFTDAWYARYIDQTKSNFPATTSDDGVAIAMAIMVAGAFIGQAIDNGIGPDAPEGNLKDAISGVASTLYDIHLERNSD